MSELTTSVLAEHHAVAVQALHPANVMAYDHQLAKREARAARRAGARWWQRSGHTVTARRSAAVCVEC